MNKWRYVLAIVFTFAVIGTAACSSDDRLSDDLVNLAIKDKAGEGSQILQIIYQNDYNRTYLVCHPDGVVALYDVFVGRSGVVFNTPISFGKGSKSLTNKPIEEVTCKKLAAVAQATPSPVQ